MIADAATADRVGGIVAQRAAQDFTVFKVLMWPIYRHARHLALIDAALTDVLTWVATDGNAGLQNLLIELPPRHGKTKTCSQLFPAWFLGHLPDMRVIMASYGSSLVEKNSRNVRNLMRSARYGAVFPSVRLSADSQAKDAWDLADPYNGGMDAIGKGGAATGKGANLLITDDVVKGRAEVESETLREKDWEWFTDDLLTRRQPNAAHIAIQTRWHTDDIHGRIHKIMGDRYRKIILPALAEDNDPLGRQPGEALAPMWYPRDYFLQMEKDLGSYGYNALYQQHPQARAGGIFKWDYFNPTLEDEPPDIVRRVRFWDLALSESTKADYTVGVLMGLTRDGRYIVLDVARFQMEWDEIPDQITRVALADGRGVSIGVETAFFQTRAVKALLKKPELHKYVITGYRPDADKYTRAAPIAARAKERIVYLLNRAWTPAFLDELCSFPLAAHDDQVDAFSGAYEMFETRKIKSEVIDPFAPAAADSDGAASFHRLRGN